MRIIGIALIAASLAGVPALAQMSCRTTNTADGIKSEVSGDVAGSAISMLVTENGPFAGKLTLDAGSAYKVAKGGPPTLKVFRAGNSLEGKDWMQPGSVETVDGGLLVSWSGFTFKGARVHNLTFKVSSGLIETRQTVAYSTKHKGPDALFLRLDGRLAAPAGSELLETNYAQLNQWRDAVASRSAFRVDVFDETTAVHIAAIDFTIPPANITQARLISDVNALRRASSEKTCKP